jgi:DNA invertase Pin-like site-specific DNA recombinase
MGAKPQIPAPQYVRMSTEDQQYSIASQEDAIQSCLFRQILDSSENRKTGKTENDKVIEF